MLTLGQESTGPSTFGAAESLSRKKCNISAVREGTQQAPGACTCLEVGALPMIKSLAGGPTSKWGH